jgi:TldD protein
MSKQKRERLPFNEKNRDIADLMPDLVSILEDGLERHCYGFVFFSEVVSRSMTVHRVDQTSSSIDRGMVFRIIYNGKNYESATNDLSSRNLIACAKKLRADVEADSPLDESKPVYAPKRWSDLDLHHYSDDIRTQIGVNPDETGIVHFSPLVSGDPLDLGMGKIGELARSFRKEIMDRDAAYCEKRNSSGKETTPLALVAVNYRISSETNLFADRYRRMSQILPIVICVASGQTVNGKSGRAILGGMGGIETVLIDDSTYRELVEVPHELDEAGLLTPGNYKVITAPGVTGVIAHEAFGHTQEGDTVRQGRSITTQIGDTTVGNQQATIVNNAAVFDMGAKEYGTNGSYFFDHEGELATVNVILDSGKLSPPMTDLLTSLHLGIRRTANGKRESWRRPTLTRQTNTYFTAGDKSVDELVAMVDHGYLAPLPHGGMEDPKGANLTAGAEYLLEIRDGELTGNYFVGPRGGHVELSGYVPDLLDGIIAKSTVTGKLDDEKNDTTPDNKIGGCGKFHKEYVKAGCGGPYILWNSMTCG